MQRGSQKQVLFKKSGRVRIEMQLVGIYRETRYGISQATRGSITPSIGGSSILRKKKMKKKITKISQHENLYFLADCQI